MREEIEILETDVAYLKGRIEALSSLCAILIATHPKASQIIQVFNRRAEDLLRLEHPTPHLKAYADGFARLEMNIDEILASFERDELKLFSKPPH